MEGARYINNQLEYAGRVRVEESLVHTTEVIGERLGETARTITMCTFIDWVLGTCWSFEDNLPPDRLSEHIAQCSWLLGRLRQRVHAEKPSP